MANNQVNDTNVDDLLKFLLYVGQAKRTFRTGWILCGVERVESVADHMYRMAIMSFLLPSVSDQSKVLCMKLALVHDLSESIVGDLTELDDISKSEKHRRETEAMDYLTRLLPTHVGTEIFSLFNEYVEQKTNEAKLVKDLDIFDMLVQAYEYEKIQNAYGFLEDFFQNSANKIKTDIVKKWLKKLIECRSSNNQLQLPFDSNLNTMLKHVLYDDQRMLIYKLPVSDIREKVNNYISSRAQDGNPSSSATAEHSSNPIKNVNDQYD
ncbi:unnamed protein product [Adineta ricciae]|uniref:5'-deoxynucleotidase HDDC2 n=1 Tax=Adineta ricciae TaxID=249248 RepID=A0A815USV0_ADIRI|nr:unnamed protein product [Adineta ricciae]CAF1520316.1 unnamed protein product [Adineta ricciae]